MGPRDRLIGQLYIEGDLRVGGILEGEVEVTGDIEIGDMAKVKASVAGGDVSVNGHLTGPVVARKRLIVGRSGSVIGDVRVARLAIQDGASFSGKVSMGAGAVEAPPRPAKAPEVEPVAKPASVSEPPVAIVEPADAIVAPAVIAPPDGKDGKAKAMPPKLMAPKAMPPKPMPSKPPPPKAKPKRR